ncbi:MAG: hypothetical protein LBE75_05070 [Burkholderiales bacterium]|jgi:type IV pili sensor histidine kinase/response regulator|nr:hypothetical protein [Burkholderiales bacterium]
MKPIYLALIAVLISACAQQPVVEPEPNPIVSPVVENPTVRYSRYTLVAATPSMDQVDLLSQIVDTRIPASMTPSIKEALGHVLLHTGYGLCPPPNPEVETLYSRPLPAAHYRIGPMPLRSALMLVAGPAYQVMSNDITRTVCFTAKPDYLTTAPAVTDVGETANAKEEIK